MVAEEHDDGGLVPRVQLVHEPAQILIRAPDGRQKLVHLGVFHLVRFQMHGISGGNEPRVVSAVVLDGDIEDELGPLSLVDLLQHALVGGAIRDEVAEGVGVFHGGDVVERVESELLVDAVAPPVGRLGRVNRMGAVPQAAEVGGEVVHPFQIVEHVGVHAAAHVAHGGAGEELELAVAGAPAHGRDVHVARGQGIVGHLVEERRRGVCSLKAGVFGEIGERLVHDGDDVGAVVGECFGLFRRCIASGGRR